MKLLALLGVLYFLGMVWALTNVRKDIGWVRIAFVTAFWWLFLGEGC